MIAAALRLLLGAVGLGCVIAWLRALAHCDGARPCSPEDCASCPFPLCTTQPKKGDTDP